MTAPIDPATRKEVVAAWLSGGLSRNQIAKDLNLSQGSVSNILEALKQGMEGGEYESCHELAAHCKKESINLADLMSALRIKNYIRELGIDEERAEQFIARYANSPDPQKLVDVLEKIGPGLDMPLEEIEEHIKLKQAEKETLQHEIERLKNEEQETRKLVASIGKDKDSFLELKEEMETCGIRSDSTQFVNLIHVFRKYNHDPSKIMNAFLEVQNVKQTKLETDARMEEATTMAQQMVALGMNYEDIIGYATLKKKGSTPGQRQGQNVVEHRGAGGNGDREEWEGENWAWNQNNGGQ